MKTRFNTRWIALAMLLAMLVALLPARAARADSGETGGNSDFLGTVQSLPAAGLIGDWKVDTRIVHVTAATQIDQEDGAVAVGAYVEVKGTRQADGSMNATEIGVKQGTTSGGASAVVKVIGTVQTLPSTTGWIGDWMVNGQTIHVSATTRINQENGKLAVGAIVKLEGLKLADNSINAGDIEVQQNSTPAGNKIEYYGVVQSLPAGGLVGDWQVSGRTIHVSAATQIKQERATIAVGTFVQVNGMQQADTSINANEVEARANPTPSTDKYIKVYGNIQSMPPAGLIGDWKVNGLTLRVSASTIISQEHGAPAVGGAVEVKGLLQADGSINALKIEVKGAGSNKPSKLFGSTAARAQTK